MDHAQPVHEPVLQLLQRFPEQDKPGGPAAVQQYEAALRFAGQDRLQNRQYGRYPGPGGDAQIGPGRSRVRVQDKAPIGRHRLDLVARLQGLVRPSGEPSARHQFDADPQLRIVQAGADRVGAAHLLPIQASAEGQILARPVAEPVRRRKGHADRVRRLPPHVRHAQRVERLQ